MSVRKSSIKLFTRQRDPCLGNCQGDVGISPLMSISSEMQLLISEKIDTYTYEPHGHVAGLCV